jgi:hypothetical protein
LLLWKTFVWSSKYSEVTSASPPKLHDLRQVEDEPVAGLDARGLGAAGALEAEDVEAASLGDAQVLFRADDDPVGHEPCLIEH